MSIEPITIPMSIEVNDVTIDSTIETNEVTIESTFDAKIEVVEGGDITVQSLTVTENGTTTAPTGKAYSPVIVNVPNTYTNSDEGKVVQNGALTSQTSTTKSANGTYDTTTNNQVTVSVPASEVDTGTKPISTNGTHDVVGYASAAVNVPNTYTASDEGKVVDNGVLVAQTSTTVTTNGTYDTTTNDEVVVNVSGGTPTLITKTITENGTYSAEDDDADGYSEVTVNVSGGGTSGLPSEYEELTYISAPPVSASPYIETNYTPVQGDEVSVSFSAYGLGYPVYSAGSGTYQLIIIPYDAAAGNRIYCKYFASGTAKELGLGIEKYVFYDIDVDSTGKFTLTGDISSTVTSPYEGAVDSNLYVFKRAGQNTYFKGEVGKLIITNSGVDKLKLIPARRKSDSVVGMYDMVSNTFYTNAGTGTFGAGAVIIDDSEALSIMLGGE